ncbi:hypothetical protein MCOR17_009409 [Pyricularia oryzae]|nr:hypothetical protein MCOR17_009409 [Pyricularia oryzae]
MSRTNTYSPKRRGLNRNVVVEHIIQHTKGRLKTSVSLFEANFGAKCGCINLNMAKHLTWAIIYCSPCHLRVRSGSDDESRHANVGIGFQSPGRSRLWIGSLAKCVNDIRNLAPHQPSVLSLFRGKSPIPRTVVWRPLKR